MARTIREIPILMQTDMARAFINDQKDVTRRTTGLDIINQDPDAWILTQTILPDRISSETRWQFINPNTGEATVVRSPYGKPGDWLWIRETWLKLDREHFVHLSKDSYQKYAYKASCDSECEDARKDYLEAGYPYQWKPSIHMPKVAARLWAENVSIRPERLHDITNDDAIREGIEPVETPGFPTTWKNYNGWTSYGNPLTSFQSLWDSINGKPKKDKPNYPWKSNPWVWRQELKKLSTTGKPALCKCGAIADKDGTCEACFNTTIYERGA